ncbi:MAG: elongation factor G, partial [Deltaproteobacteria bacterium]|nr:elongation factor G [Deltaproteobacteria bacterium]
SGTRVAENGAYNANKEFKERFGQIFQPEGKNQKVMTEALPGDIVAVAKLKETVTGDTLCSEKDPVLFKPVAPLPTIISYAVTPKNKGEEDKVFASIAKLLEEDPTLKLARNKQTKEMLLSGMGQVHIEATMEKMRRKFGVEAMLTIPKVPYLETIKGKAKVQGKYKRQTGGRGQYGDTWLEIEPLPRGGGYEFLDKIVGGVIPRQYIPAVDKGIQEAALKGVVAGFPVVDFRIALVFGSYHDVDSSEMAFKIAGSMGFKKACEEAKMVLLEPIMKIEVTVPEEFMGDIIGDLNSRRGKVLGMVQKGKSQVIQGLVPMSEILQYAPDLTSMTGGRGSFTMEQSTYEELPAHQAEKIIAEYKQAEE